MAYFINFSTGFQKFPLQTQKVRLPQQPKKRLMESLVSGSFQTVNIAGEGNCTFSRILEIVLFFFAAYGGELIGPRGEDGVAFLRRVW